MFAAAAALGCSARESPATRDSGGETAGPHPHRGKTSATNNRETFLGVIVAPEAVELAAKVDGTIAEVKARVGERFAGGEVIATIDTSQLRRDRDMARALLDQAKAAEERAELELNAAEDRLSRRRALQAAISREDLLNAEHQAKLAAAELKLTRARSTEQAARLEQLQQLVNEGAIRAPFDGVVAARHADPGATIARGSPIVRFLREKPLLVRFAVPENKLSAVQRGLAVQLELDAVSGSCTAVVETIAPEVDSATRLVFIEAQVSEDCHSGQTVLGGRMARVVLSMPLTALPRP